MAGDKTRRAHTVEGIICYSYLLVPYCIGFYLPGATCRALGLIVTARPWAIKDLGRPQYWTSSKTLTLLDRLLLGHLGLFKASSTLD
jgi:hypothetical protein